MRLDKFLKVSRIIKRRTVAKEVADKGRVRLNSQVAKSSSPVKEGDELTIDFANRRVTYRILELHDSTKKEEAEKMFEIINEEEKSDS